MKSRTPQKLSECALKPLICVTFSALQKVDSDYTAGQNRLFQLIEASASFALRTKRKLPEESVDTSEPTCSRKRIRRRSLHFPSSHKLGDSLSRSEDSHISKDDNWIECGPVSDTIIILRNFFNYLPQALWDNYFNQALKKLNYSESEDKNLNLGLQVFELLFCKKVHCWSTKLLYPCVYDKYEKFIYERLCFCSTLKKLEIHHTYRPDTDQTFLQSLCKLKNLRSIVFLPSKKQSFHSSIAVIGRNCTLLEELTLMYDSEHVSSPENNVSCLKSCPNLRKLILHSYGRGCETEFIDILLKSLKNLQQFFHRELPHAIIDLFLKGYKEGTMITLSLRVLLLAVFCKGIGSQLCYIPDDSVIQIASVCPNITHLNLIRPSNLVSITHFVPHLRQLVIHDWDIRESFAFSSFNEPLKNLRILAIRNTEYLSYECISQLSEICPNLQELEISNTNLFPSNNFKFTPTVSSLHLRKLAILKTPVSDQTEPRFLTPHKMHIDKYLLKFLISGSRELEELYLEFDNDSVRSADPSSIPNEKELVEYIGSCSVLKDLMLLSCPNVSFKMIDSVASKCPDLQRLWHIDQWEIPPNEMDRILRKFSHTFFQSHERMA